jgi:hypothetical protein
MVQGAQVTSLICGAWFVCGYGVGSGVEVGGSGVGVGGSGVGVGEGGSSVSVGGG